MTRLQAARALISDARRERLTKSMPRLDPDRAPHPRRAYWRDRARRIAAERDAA